MTVAERSLGFSIVSWIEALLCHGPGDVQGEPVTLDPEFTGSILDAYELDEHGRRVVSEFHLWAPKGRAKSELAGMIAVAEALGPTRFDHWAIKGESSPWGHQYEKGEPVGKPPTFPFIRCLATEEGQSGNTYANVQFMIEHGVDRGYFSADPGLTRTFLPDGGEIRPSSASAASKDGGKESFAVFDETHLYSAPELHRMYHTVRRNLTKRKGAQPWSLATSTMYLPGEGSIAEVIHHHAEAVDRGEVTDPGFRFRWFAGPRPDEFDFENDAELRAALRQAYGSAVAWMDLDSIVREIRHPLTEPEDALRYFVNVPAGRAEDVVDLDKWRDLEDRTAELVDGDSVVVGFDGSQSDDATSLVVIRPRDGVAFEYATWEKPRDIRGKTWSVPRPEVDQTVDEIFSRFRVVRMYADPPRWQSYLDRWIAAYGKKTVLEWPSWSDRRIVQSTDTFSSLVRAGELKHAPSNVLDRHVGNARRGKARGGWRPVKKADARKIDAFLALLAAVAAWGDAVKSGELEVVAVDPLANIW